MEPRPPVSLLKKSLLCRCPRCGTGPLFSGFLTVAKTCTSCGLDLHAQDSADGPAVFIMFITGPAVVGAALWTEATFAPPYWVHVVLWPPAILIASLALLRPLKALFVALQYRNKAGEGGRNTFD